MKVDQAMCLRRLLADARLDSALLGEAAAGRLRDQAGSTSSPDSMPSGREGAEGGRFGVLGVESGDETGPSGRGPRGSMARRALPLLENGDGDGAQRVEPQPPNGAETDGE